MYLLSFPFDGGGGVFDFWVVCFVDKIVVKGFMSIGPLY